MPIDFETDDTVVVNDSADFDYGAGDWYISVLLRPHDATLLANPITKDITGTGNRQFHLTITSTGLVRLVYWKTGGSLVFQASAAQQVFDNTWTHVLTQKRSGAFEIYIDGVSVALGSITGTHGTMDSTPADVVIGARGDGVNPFHGDIDELSTGSGSFNADEAFILGQSGRKGIIMQLSSPAAYWPLDDGFDGTSADGDTVRDLSGNGNDGIGDDGANNTGLIWKAEEVLSYSNGVLSTSFEIPVLSNLNLFHLLKMGSKEGLRLGIR